VITVRLTEQARLPPVPPTCRGRIHRKIPFHSSHILPLRTMNLTSSLFSISTQSWSPVVCILHLPTSTGCLAWSPSGDRLFQVYGASKNTPKRLSAVPQKIRSHYRLCHHSITRSETPRTLLCIRGQRWIERPSYLSCASMSFTHLLSLTSPPPGETCSSTTLGTTD
jgi:hypothetical protein